VETRLNTLRKITIKSSLCSPEGTIVPREYLQYANNPSEYIKKIQSEMITELDSAEEGTE